MAKKDLRNLLERGVVEVIVKKDLAAKLNSGRPLRVKLGIDPTGADLHLGHMVVVKKLREFQRLGHQIQLLFGNFTGQIGDPTGKLASRQAKTQTELERNAAKYLDQVKVVLDIDKVQIFWNAEWLAPLDFSQVIGLASNFTVAQMLERDMFQERIKKNLPIGMQEFFYPLMQGYDSVALRSDVELGGTDQTFNLLAGRVLQKAHGQEPQNVITVPILEGTDGKIKMGKSENNYIGVAEDPRSMFGKTMSIPDELIERYFVLATDFEPEEIESVRADLAAGANPRDLKLRLAKEIVSIYHGETAAADAEQEFINVFSEQGLPDDIETYASAAAAVNILDLLLASGLIASKGEGRRLVQGGGVKLDGAKICDINRIVDLGPEPLLLQVGRRRFKYLKQG